MNDLDLRMREKHFLEGVERRDLEFFRGVIRSLLVEIANRDKLCQRVVLDAGGVLIADAAHTDNGTLKNFFHWYILSGNHPIEKYKICLITRESRRNSNPLS